jgi:Pectate lyase superfamily protein
MIKIINIFMLMLIIPSTYSFSLGIKQKSSSVIGVSVKDYGAIGDGVNDDTKAIQRTVDNAFQDGKVVLLPKGGYKITSPIVIHRGVELYGSGYGFGSSLIPYGCDAIWIKGDTQEGGFAFRNKLQSINVNMVNAKESDGLVIHKAYNIKLEDIFIFNSSAVGINLNFVKHVTIDNVIVYGDNSKNSVGIRIKNGIANFYNIDIEQTNIGLEVGPDVSDNSHISVFGGFIERFETYGIKINDSRNNTFIGLNIQADSKNKLPVFNSEDRGVDLQNTFIGGYIGYSKDIMKKDNKNIDSLRRRNHIINVGD